MSDVVLNSDADLKGMTDRLVQERGYSVPSFEWLTEKDPTFDEIRLRLATHTFTPPPTATLDVKTREIIAAVVLACRFYPSVENHLRRAIKLGVPMQQLIEAMEVAAVPGGFPVLHFTLPYLIKIEEEMRAQESGG